MTAVSEQIGNWLDQFGRQEASLFQPLRDAGFRLFVVSNQAGVALGRLAHD